jgi:uncharacterized protein (DUF58 family)
MVRREEQRWQDRAVLILDSRRSAHAGTGPSSSFEYAVSAAASIGVHLARSGLDGHLLTDAGPLVGPAMFEDVLLDALSVVSTSRNHDFSRSTAALSTIEGGLLVVIAGRLSADAATEIATARRHGRQGIALLLAVSTWATQSARNAQADEPVQASQPGLATVSGDGDGSHNGHRDNGDKYDYDKSGTSGTSRTSRSSSRSGDGGAPELVTAASGQDGWAVRRTETWPAENRPAETQSTETAASAAILRAAGWRVISVDAATPLAVAWQQLPKFGSNLQPAGQSGLGKAAR